MFTFRKNIKKIIKNQKRIYQQLLLYWKLWIITKSFTWYYFWQTDLLKMAVTIENFLSLKGNRKMWICKRHTMWVTWVIEYTFLLVRSDISILILSHFSSIFLWVLFFELLDALTLHSFSLVGNLHISLNLWIKLE